MCGIWNDTSLIFMCGAHDDKNLCRGLEIVLRSALNHFCLSQEFFQQPQALSSSNLHPLGASESALVVQSSVLHIKPCLLSEDHWLFDYQRGRVVGRTLLPFCAIVRSPLPPRSNFFCAI